MQRLLHYDIVREIGRGGMGIVYEARDTRLDRPVAIKILPPDKISDPGRKQRFVHESESRQRAEPFQHRHGPRHHIRRWRGHDRDGVHVIGMSGQPIWQKAGRLRFYDYQSARISTVAESGDGIALGLAVSPNGPYGALFEI